MEKKKKSFQKRPQWNEYLTDTSQYQLEDKELLRKKILRRSSPSSFFSLQQTPSPLQIRNTRKITTSVAKKIKEKVDQKQRQHSKISLESQVDQIDDKAAPSNDQGEDKRKVNINQSQASTSSSSCRRRLITPCSDSEENNDMNRLNDKVGSSKQDSAIGEKLQALKNLMEKLEQEVDNFENGSATEANEIESMDDLSAICERLLSINICLSKKIQKIEVTVAENKNTQNELNSKVQELIDSTKYIQLEKKNQELSNCVALLKENQLSIERDSKKVTSSQDDFQEKYNNLACKFKSLEIFHDEMKREHNEMQQNHSILQQKIEHLEQCYLNSNNIKNQPIEGTSIEYSENAAAEPRPRKKFPFKPSTYHFNSESRGQYNAHDTTLNSQKENFSHLFMGKYRASTDSMSINNPSLYSIN